MSGDPAFGEKPIESRQEPPALNCDEAKPKGVDVDVMSVTRIRAIRRKAATSAKAFEARFGIPAATINNWEQGRRAPDPASRLLLKAIEMDPDFVEKAARSA